ncbi:MAG: DMT family transporter, partial [Methanobacteriota archaeon]
MSALSDLAFGLTTAFGYGTGDFLARQASHRIGHVRVLFFLEVFGMLIFLPIALWFERDGWSATDPWALLVALGAINFLASLWLYRSFEYGVLSVVSPLVSSYPAVTASLAFLLLGERPTALASAGIAIVLAGTVLLSRSKSHPGNPPPKDARVGLVSAFGAFAGYGVFFFALDAVVGPIGPVTSAAVVRGVGSVILFGLVAAGRLAIGRPPRALWAALAAIVALDEIAFVAFNVGILVGSVAIVGTLSGLFSAVTVALAAGFLRERLTRAQAAAIGAIFLGIAFIA